MDWSWSAGSTGRNRKPSRQWGCLSKTLTPTLEPRCRSARVAQAREGGTHAAVDKIAASMGKERSGPTPVRPTAPLSQSCEWATLVERCRTVTGRAPLSSGCDGEQRRRRLHRHADRAGAGRPVSWGRYPLRRRSPAVAVERGEAFREAPWGRAPGCHGTWPTTGSSRRSVIDSVLTRMSVLRSAAVTGLWRCAIRDI
jgi:hypothetical protein